MRALRVFLDGEGDLDDGLTGARVRGYEVLGDDGRRWNDLQVMMAVLEWGKMGWLRLDVGRLDVGRLR